MLVLCLGACTATHAQETELLFWTNLPTEHQFTTCDAPINWGKATAKVGTEAATVTQHVTNSGLDKCQTHNGIAYGYRLASRWEAKSRAGTSITTETFIWVLPSSGIGFVHHPGDVRLTCSDEYAFVQPEARSIHGEILGIEHEDDYDFDACGAGTVTRTWTATDAKGNTAQAQQVMVTLADAIKPEISLPVASIAVGSLEQVAKEVKPVISDNCTYIDDLILTYSDEQSGSTVKRTYIVADICGNTNTAELTITLIDNDSRGELPTFELGE